MSMSVSVFVDANVYASASGYMFVSVPKLLFAGIGVRADVAVDELLQMRE